MIAPAPWAIRVSRLPTANNSFHLYLVDANDRKIAVVWGKPAEKVATADLMLEAPTMREILLGFVRNRKDIRTEEPFTGPLARLMDMAESSLERTGGIE